MKRLLGILLLVSTVALADDVYYWVEKEQGVKTASLKEQGVKTNNYPQQKTQVDNRPQIRYLNSSQDTVKVIIKR